VLGYRSLLKRFQTIFAHGSSFIYQPALRCFPLCSTNCPTHHALLILKQLLTVFNGTQKLKAGFKVDTWAVIDNVYRHITIATERPGGITVATP